MNELKVYKVESDCLSHRVAKGVSRCEQQTVLDTVLVSLKPTRTDNFKRDKL